ncbi:MAG: asparagine synthase C-terminal domain-containing protein [Thermoplasmata archaeon]
MKDRSMAPSERLIGLLRTEISRISASGAPVSISFSGGLDSTLIAKLSQEFCNPECIVVGLPGSTDIANARKASDILGVDLKEVELTEDRVKAEMRNIISSSGTKDPVFISFEIPIAIALRESSNRTILTGQGADELFGGYAKYLHLSEREFKKLQEIDFEKLMRVTIPFEDGYALRVRKKIERPFVSQSVVSWVRSLDIRMLMPDAVNKGIIRSALIELGLKDVARLPKKAAQYGSGAMNLMRKIAKSKGLSVNGLIEELAVSGK